MSKWINKDLFNQYVEKKENEQIETKTFIRKSERVWPNPTAGTTTQAEIYEGRFLPDPKNNFTSKYFYHMWKSADKWNYVFCPKTWDFNNYCPICALTNKLYMGTSKDKSIASQMKRKSRHVANFYIITDKRDLKVLEEEKKMEGKVKIYEFPDKVDAKLKLQLLDKNEGLGYQIFDPGDEGHNFILRIKSTKPDVNNKSYPDYADSDFSRKSSAIGTDKKIKEIMDSRYELDEYIKSLETPKENIITILKNEMLYDIIKDEWMKQDGDISDKRDGITENETDIEEVEKLKKLNKKEEDDVPIDLTDEDDDLLKELDLMK